MCSVRRKFLWFCVVITTLILPISAYSTTVLKDGNGEIIGQFLGYVDPTNPYRFLVSSRTGYVFILSYRFSSGNFVDNVAFIETYRIGISENDGIYFDSADCSGTSYFEGVTSGVVTYLGDSLDDRYLYKLDFVNLYYVPKGAIPVSKTPLSIQVAPYRFSSEVRCYTPGFGTTEYITVLPNDPAVTGISKSSFPTPIYFDFDYRFGSPEVFYDRFQNSNE